MPEHRELFGDEDGLIEAMSDIIDAAGEADFDPAALDPYLDALDRRAGGASLWNASLAQRAFREKHAELFSGEAPAVPAPRGAGRARIRGRRLAGRVAAVAAVAVLGAMLVCQALGIDVFGFWGKWGREQFWFPTTQQQNGPPDAPSVREGNYESLAAALEANGVLSPIAPTWVPGAGENFGPLTGTFTASRESQSALFTGDYRDRDGRGYTVSIERHDFGGAFLPHTLGRPDTEEYVCDGTTYYIGKGNGGVTRVDWFRDQLSGVIEGDLDGETARRLAESVTRPGGGRVYHAPDAEGAGKVPGNDLPSMLEVCGLSPELAPAWLPEGFEKTDIYEASSFGGDVRTVYAAYDNAAEERELCIQITWWEDPAVPVPPVFAGTWVLEGTEVRYGREFRILTDGDARLVSWLDGHVSGWIWGGLSMEEAVQMARSMPDWPDERPAREEPGIVVDERDVKEYDSPASALADRGLDAGLAPAWVPEGYALESVEGEKNPFGIQVYAAWFQGEALLSFHLTCAEEGTESSGVSIYEKDDNPVVEYVHNGLRFYIMTNGEYRTVVWKDGPLEGSLSGPITLEEAKQMVDSISYTPAE